MAVHLHTHTTSTAKQYITSSLTTTTWHNSMQNIPIISFLIKSIVSIVPACYYTRCLCASFSSSLPTPSLPLYYASSTSPQSSAGIILPLNVNAHHLDDRRFYGRLLVQLEETERRFDEFWSTHLTRLKQCLDLRRFEQDFRELQVSIWGFKL